jgi:uncharacterized protein involved in exopolysaccharide biosynthesis
MVQSQEASSSAVNLERNFGERVASFFVRRMRLVALAIAVGALAGIVFVLLRGARYEVQVQFQPRASSRSGLGSLAAQLGVDPGGNVDSPQFYSELLKVQDLLAIVADAPTATGTGGEAKPLWAVFGYSKLDSLRRTAMTARSLRGMLTVAADRRTGIVSFIVTHRDPKLGYSIASNLMNALRDFDVDRRRGRAAVERRFVETRVGELSTEARVAEDSLARFLAQNRAMGSSPQLEMQRERLLRVVQLRQSVLVSLSQALEQAKIEELRDTPLVTVLQEPAMPSIAVPRKWIQWTLFGVIVALVALVVWNERGVVRREIFALSVRSGT